MKKLYKGMMFVLGYFGIYPDQFFTNVRSLGWYFRDYFLLKRQLRSTGSSFRFGIPYPVFNEKHAESGNLSGHYFHQDLLVAQQIFNNKPLRHVDIGSRTDGFVAHVASFREIEVFDIRKADVQISNMRFVQADFMNIPDSMIDYTDSVSSLHVLEHFGLGRYNDPIDAEGHLKGLDSIFKILRTGGKFYFSTPIGPERINFNAQRVFNLSTLVRLFEGKYRIDSFSYVDDSGALFRDVDIEEELMNNFGCRFGCGIFVMTKL